MDTISWPDFEKVEIRVGTVLTAEPFPEARVPAFKLTIDFGPLGIKQTSAQITKRYDPTWLVGRQVLAVTNFLPKKIAGFRSEVLVLGAVPDEGDVVLLNLDEEVENGVRVL
ncbi:MAG: tRNA-binding protein [bacterium]|nr:tRNA-binding protein [bacterium]MDT8365543.1 tRNA-binding protein [bacterium]